MSKVQSSSLKMHVLLMEEVIQLYHWSHLRTYLPRSSSNTKQVKDDVIHSKV